MVLMITRAVSRIYGDATPLESSTRAQCNTEDALEAKRSVFHAGGVPG